ncbi:type II toxin-antitoxin system death-on-curing family toxin [Fervidibacter sacchari]|jgi:death-on-curing family protein|uniref:Death-on-curing protein n=1 Tax=Candidatus Fervidibacter sacchari TaxID=1448929 RepID=A0ABT2EPV7_9BACT|nr:type II toxin-antitoxin system death-on-curing family toxin [Candidatus Fervidibacter sacchari]MCS3919890.1 death-on-curing protein [Candidatus Fervidibacter sacchari]WKU16872.1 type II toxin-antitoxin system death-on-curing family toxin [Candidatus Fervidibacter sacchari]
MAEPKIKIVNLEEVMELHEEWLRRLGGIAGIRNHEVLMYAFEAQVSPYYRTVFEKAANFGGRIVKEHAFNDGNKRTGYSCMKLFLARNGYLLQPTFEEAYPTLLRLALGTGVTGEMTYDELAEWLETHSLRIAECVQE